MSNESTFIEFLITKINKARRNRNSCPVPISFGDEPHQVGCTLGASISEDQIDNLETYGLFLNSIPKEQYNKYATGICNKMDFYNTANDYDAYKKYRSKEPNKVRKRVLTKISNLREELSSAEEIYGDYLSKEEIEERVNGSKQYTLVSLLDELASYLKDKKSMTDSFDDIFNEKAIADNEKFYRPYKVSRNNTLRPLFMQIVEDFNIRGGKLSVKDLLNNLG